MKGKFDMEVELIQNLCQKSAFIGKSRHADRIRAFAKKASSSPLTVFLQGETGVGKDLLAWMIHDCGRSGSPFVPVNCSALTDTLFASELFGHRKGSFTGANEDRQGFFESAGEGTVFLDEVGTLPASSQVKLLRVLQDGKFCPVGDRRQIQMKARVITATNSDMESAVSRREFRSDLFYRLNVVPFFVPSLRDRSEDIPLLAEHFLSSRTSIIRFSPEALQVMKTYEWPGNVRELENVVARAWFFSEGEEITSEQLRSFIDGKCECREAQVEKHKEVQDLATRTEKDGKFPTFREVKEAYLRKLLENTRGNVVKGCKVADVSQRSIKNWVKEFGLRDFLRSIRENRRMENRGN